MAAIAAIVPASNENTFSISAETLKLKIRDVSFKTIDNSQYGEVAVNGKTGTRPIPLINSLPYLEDYLAHGHPMPSNPGASLICGI
jgi:hypothetical protein